MSEAQQLKELYPGTYQVHYSTPDRIARTARSITELLDVNKSNSGDENEIFFGSTLVWARITTTEAVERGEYSRGIREYVSSITDWRYEVEIYGEEGERFDNLAEVLMAYLNSPKPRFS